MEACICLDFPVFLLPRYAKDWCQKPETNDVDRIPFSPIKTRCPGSPWDRHQQPLMGDSRPWAPWITWGAIQRPREDQWPTTMEDVKLPSPGQHTAINEQLPHKITELNLQCYIWEKNKRHWKLRKLSSKNTQGSWPQNTPYEPRENHWPLVVFKVSIWPAAFPDCNRA